MTTGNWFNNDGLYLEFGTTKAQVDTAGEYKMFGPQRIIEVDIDISTLTTTAAIQSNNTFFPIGTNIQIDKVEVIAQVAVATITSFSVGLMKQDRTTALSDTALINAMTQAVVGTAGNTQVLTAGSTAAGAYVGATAGGYVGAYAGNPTEMAYMTAKIAGSAGTGKVRVRIFLSAVGTITQ